MVTALFTILRKLATGRVRPIGGLSECACVLAPFFEMGPGYKRCDDASQFQSASRHGG